MKKHIPVAAILLSVALLCLSLAGCGNAQSMVSFNVVTVDSEIFMPPFLCMTFGIEGKGVVFQTKMTTSVAGADVQNTADKNLANGGDLIWMPDQGNLDKKQKAVVEVIAIAERHVVGYLVISATSDVRNEQGVKISYKVVKEERFPQKNGEYQDITLEEVQEMIDKAAQNA